MVGYSLEQVLFFLVSARALFQNEPVNTHYDTDIS